MESDGLGRETMQKKKRKLHAKRTGYAGLLLAALFVLGGCTKKEELLLLNEEGADGKPETVLSVGQESFSETEPDPQTYLPQEDPSMQSEQEKENDTPVRTEPDVICVHVCGAVQWPGVYKLQVGSRVYEAVQAAGGFSQEADQNYVNQARELADGVKLVIPTVEEAEKARDRELAAGGQDAGGSGNGTMEDAAVQIGIVADTAAAETESAVQNKEKNAKVNINTASEAQLCDIPGIGATRAAAIAAYRESHGGFQKPEDIMKVNGIKEGMYEKIKDSICVN